MRVCANKDQQQQQHPFTASFTEPFWILMKQEMVGWQ